MLSDANDYVNSPDADSFRDLSSVEDAFHIIREVKICPVFGERGREGGASETAVVDGYNVVVPLRYSLRLCKPTPKLTLLTENSTT